MVFERRVSPPVSLFLDAIDPGISLVSTDPDSDPEVVVCSVVGSMLWMLGCAAAPQGWVHVWEPMYTTSRSSGSPSVR
jgi:hypothetical protein